MTRVALVLCCVMIVYGVARAQDNSQAPQVLDDLKLQLIDVQAKQEAVTEQIQQLDEALKPENIEHSLAGFGSTRPEELREHLDHRARRTDGGHRRTRETVSVRVEH